MMTNEPTMPASATKADSNSKKSLKILLVSDIDGDSANKMTEKFVRLSPEIDCILCCGPFSRSSEESGSSVSWSESKEAYAICLANISSMIASFEQIQCRVIYLPSHLDPPTSYNQELHLTPNSINIHNRRMNLVDNLFVAGFTEASENLSDDPDAHIDCEEYESLDEVEVKSSMSAIDNIEAVLSGSNHGQEGIFILKYKFAHTLNHFLFHMTERVSRAGIQFCIIPSVINGESVALPAKWGDMKIIIPCSLRLHGKYKILEFSQNNGTWSLDKIEEQTI